METSVNPTQPPSCRGSIWTEIATSPPLAAFILFAICRSFYLLKLMQLALVVLCIVLSWLNAGEDNFSRCRRCSAIRVTIVLLSCLSSDGFLSLSKSAHLSTFSRISLPGQGGLVLARKQATTAIQANPRRIEFGDGQNANHAKVLAPVAKFKLNKSVQV